MDESTQTTPLPSWARQLLGPLAPEIERIGVRKVAAMAAVALFVAAGVFGITMYASQETMVPLYRDLEPEDAGAVLDKLKERGVAVEVQDGGRTLLVPQSKVHELRIELATAGLPESKGVGFELFDRTMFATSDLVEQVNLLRALQGELARSIGRLDPVAHATVHIARPRPSVFASRQGKTSASVVLSLKPGRKLSDRQIDGIVHLVSHAVDGLAPENVTIVDKSGVALAPADPAHGGASGGGGGLSLQEEVERHLTHKAQSMLDAALGPGKAFVRVVAELDLEHIEETRERFDPDGQVARHETTSSRTTQRRKGTTTESGRTGARSRLQAAVGEAPGGGQIETEEKTVTEYEIGKSVQKIVKSAGGIKRLSVSLAVDEQLADKLDAIEKIVKTAVGYDERRGDSFDRAAVAKSAEDPWNDPELLRAAERRELIELVLRHGLPGFAGLLLTVSMLGLARRASRRGRERREQVERAANPFGTRLDVRTPEGLEDQSVADAAFGLATVQALSDELRDAAREDPTAAAKLLRSWLRASETANVTEEQPA